MRFMCTKIMRLTYLIGFTCYLVNMVIQSLSQSFPMEMRKPVVRLYIMWPSWDVSYSYRESRTCID